MMCGRINRRGFSAMDVQRLANRSEPAASVQDLETRLNALRVVAGGGAAPAPEDPFDRDEEIRRRALDLLTAAKQRIAAAEQRASDAETERRQREIELRAQIERLEAAKEAAEERAARAEQRAESAGEFLARLNESLRDLAG
jgi:hypothetical protein